MIDTMTTMKDLFLMEDGTTYLNCANMSPMLRAAREAGMNAIDRRSTPWNITSADWFTNSEKARELVAQIFQTNSDNIALIPSASYGLAIAGKNLSVHAGKEIIILDQQFPSNYYVWEHLARQDNLRLVVIKKSKDKTLTESILERIHSNTGIVAIPNCHWIDGVWIDLQQITKAVKSVGAYLVLDLSQSLGVLPIDIESIQPDFAVSVGYKWLLGPYSLGYLYISKKWQKAGEPLEYSWINRKGSEDFSALTNYVAEYRPGARKYDMGEASNFISLPMAIAALEQINKWKVGFIQSELKKLTDPVNDFKKRKGLGNDKHAGVGHIASIPIDKMDINKLKEKLQKNKVVISFRGSTIRVSPHLYNEPADIEKLLSCLDN